MIIERVHDHSMAEPSMIYGYREDTAATRRLHAQHAHLQMENARARTHTMVSIIGIGHVSVLIHCDPMMFS